MYLAVLKEFGIYRVWTCETPEDAEDKLIEQLNLLKRSHPYYEFDARVYKWSSFKRFRGSA